MGQGVLTSGNLKSKIGIITVDLSSTADIVVTGLGFRPKKIDFSSVVDGSTIVSWGAGNAIANGGVYFRPAAGYYYNPGAYCAVAHQSTGVYALYSVKSIEADGFTLQVTIPDSTPAGSMFINFSAEG